MSFCKNSPTKVLALTVLLLQRTKSKSWGLLVQGPKIHSCIVLVILSVFSFGSVVHAELRDPVEAEIEPSCEGQLVGEALKQARQKWSGKTVILDTNVLLNDPYAVYKYPGATIILTATVAEEMGDMVKKRQDQDIRLQARIFGRAIDELLRKGGNIRKGIEVMPGTILKMDSHDYSSVLEGTGFDKTKNDNLILATAMAYTYATDGYGDVILVTDDINLRIKAASEEIVAIPFEYEWVTSTPEKLHEVHRHKITHAEWEIFQKEGQLPKPEDLKLKPNEFVILLDNDEEVPETGWDRVARYVYDRENPEKSGLRKLADFSKLPFVPLNIEQAMALDILLDPTVELVIMETGAGKGKTFITLMAALMQLKGKGPVGIYDEVKITRPLVHLGKTELGALPGDKDEKLAEYFASYYDNLRIIHQRMSHPGQHNNSRREKFVKYPQNAPPRRTVLSREKHIKIPNMELMPFPYIRGRSLLNSFVVVDEFQNTSTHEAKTMLTRVGDGSKTVLLGDSSQIDVPYLNAHNNGLTVAASLFASDSLTDEERSRVAFVTLKAGVRSAIAEISRKLFEKPLKAN